MANVGGRDLLALTEIQLRILKYLRGYYQRHGYYATVRDVARYMGWSSTGTAHESLKALERKGRVKKLQLTKHTYVYVTVE